MRVYVNYVCRLLRYFLERIRKYFCFYFHLSSFLGKDTFTFYPSSFLQNTFTFAQVVLREMTFTFTQVPNKATRLNVVNTHIEFTRGSSRSPVSPTMLNATVDHHSPLSPTTVY